MKRILFIFILLPFLFGFRFNSDIPTEKINDLMSFAKLYGYVKYFHPSSEAQKIDWKLFAVYGVREIIKANSQEEVKNILQKLFLPIAPSLVIYFPGDKGISVNFASMKPNDTIDCNIVYWRHKGDGIENNNDSNNAYRSILKKNNCSENLFPEDSVKFGDVIENTLPDGLKFKLPIALYYKMDSSIPAADEKEFAALNESLVNEKPFSFEDNAFAIANIIIAWNTLEHFFPYFDVIPAVSENQTTRSEYWNEKLKDFISMALNPMSEKDHIELMQRLASTLDDGHAWVNYLNDERSDYPPFRAAWIQDSVVITDILEKNKNEIIDKNEIELKPGDVILKINNEDIYDLLNRKDSLVSAATIGFKRMQSIGQVLKGPTYSEMEIVFSRNGNKFSKKVRRNYRNKYYYGFKEVASVKQISKNIFYINLMSDFQEIFKNKIDSISNAKGVILDLRGYPIGYAINILSNLTPSVLRSEKWMVPVITRPDYSNVSFDSSGIWEIPAIAPKLKGKIVFLTNPKAISYSETIMGIVEYYKLAEIVGSTTAGTNGNVNRINLLGGIQINFTGMKVLKQDGSRYHGIGVKPTVPVERTIKGVREGRDEVLEKALELFK